MDDVKLIEDGKVLIISIDGTFSISQVVKLKKSFFNFFKNKKLFIFDLSNTKWIDSFGMGFIAWVVKNAIILDSEVSIINPEKNVIDIFKKTKLVEIVTFWNSIEQAKSGLNIG
ncbi:MAG: STAS domain-containing protein [Brevinematia bacterium]